MLGTGILALRGSASTIVSKDTPVPSKFPSASRSWLMGIYTALAEDCVETKTSPSTLEAEGKKVAVEINYIKIINIKTVQTIILFYPKGKLY